MNVGPKVGFKVGLKVGALVGAKVGGEVGFLVGLKGKEFSITSRINNSHTTYALVGGGAAPAELYKAKMSATNKTFRMEAILILI